MAGQGLRETRAAILAAVASGYLKDVLERLPTQPASRVGELLPHLWQPSRSA